MPSVTGEKVVLRLVDHSERQPSLDHLGVEAAQFRALEQAIHASQGFVLISGPTGSGKTTTLYSALDEIADPQMNVATLEDPVERVIPGAVQTQIDETIGLTFPVVLRSLLRQDPDAVMVGEIRDTDTASIALKAALTGHRVLSTIHTNDAASTITRLIDMGVEPYLIGSALSIVVSQRLVRTTCDHCATTVGQPAELAAEMKLHLPSSGNWRMGVGCDQCAGTGFSGRRAIFETMPITRAIRFALSSSVTALEIQKIASQEGHRSLWHAGLRIAALGETTLGEVARVLTGTVQSENDRPLATS